MNDPIWELTDSAIVLPVLSKKEMKECLLTDLLTRVIDANQALERIDLLGLWPSPRDEDYASWLDLCETLNALFRVAPESLQDRSGQQEEVSHV